MNNTSADPERASRPRTVTLLAVICVALVAAVGYNFWSAGKNEVKAVERTTADFIVTWRCLACEHEEDGPGESCVRPCPECGKEELYVCIRHGCPRHGVLPVAFEYDDEFEPVRLKVADGEWKPYADEDFQINTHCPRCGQIMMPVETPRPIPRQVDADPE